MNQGKYESLREQYPEYISLDQLHKVCGVAKRSAQYLVEHGIIPAIDTGKKTWKYRIAIDDVIAYLIKLEEVGSMIPRGTVTSHKPKHTRILSKGMGVNRPHAFAMPINLFYCLFCIFHNAIG